MKRRRLVEIDPADAGTRRLWGIGYPKIAALAGVPEGTVRQAVKRGQLDPGDPLALADWIKARRPASVITITAHGGPFCGGELRVLGSRRDRQGMDIYALECQRCKRKSDRLLAGGVCTDLHPDHKPTHTITSD